MLGQPLALSLTGGGTLGRDGFLTPLAVDLEQKGACDIISGCERGNILRFRNDGTPEQPRFTQLNPLRDTHGVEIRQWPSKDGRGSIQGPAEDEWGYTGVAAGNWCRSGLQDIQGSGDNFVANPVTRDDGDLILV